MTYTLSSLASQPYFFVFSVGGSRDYTLSMIKLAYPDLKAVNFSVGRSRATSSKKAFGKFLSYESCNSNAFASTHGHDMHDFMCGAFLT